MRTVLLVALTLTWGFGVSTLAAPPDVDNDGVLDHKDNCVERYNHLQVDSDGDGYGNWCDGDFDNNGTTDGADFIVMRGCLAAQKLAVCDTNSDGQVNAEDYWLWLSMFGMPPGPSAIDTPPSGGAQ